MVLNVSSQFSVHMNVTSLRSKNIGGRKICKNSGMNPSYKQICPRYITSKHRNLHFSGYNFKFRFLSSDCGFQGFLNKFLFLI